MVNDYCRLAKEGKVMRGVGENTPLRGSGREKEGNPRTKTAVLRDPTNNMVLSGAEVFHICVAFLSNVVSDPVVLFRQ
jgi:hypothetical protein